MAEWEGGRSNYIYVKRGTKPQMRSLEPINPQHETDFGAGRHSSLFCTRNKVEVLRRGSVPCGNVKGVDGCMDCPYAYIQVLSVNSQLKEAEKKLVEIGAIPKQKEPEKPSRFEDII